jgi:hypothetical protein
MYTPPKGVDPGSNIEPEEPTPVETTSRPAEKVSPSQHGRYLSALEKKEKEAKIVSKEEEGKEIEEKKGDVFHLASTLKAKEKKQMKDASEEGAGGSTEDDSDLPKATTAKAAVPHEDVSTKITPPPQTLIAQVPVEGQVPDTEETPPTPKQIPTGQPATPKAPVTSSKLRQSEAHQAEKARVAFTSLLEGTKEKEIVPAGMPKKDVGMASAKPTTVPPPVVATTQSTVLTEAPKEAPKSVRTDFVALAQRMADAISTMVTDKKTTITVKLSQPPVFEGATLTVVEDQSAKKQFNITFTDLSPDARRLIESQSNQTQLRQTLIDRGYTLHMITIESPRPVVVQTPESRPGGESAERSFEEKGETEQGEQTPFR